MSTSASANVKILDYHMGNMFSVESACREVGLNAAITSDNAEIAKADALILPGVGAFAEAMKNLQRLDLINPLKDFVQSGRPFLGICLGMQLLFTESEEFGITRGLDIVSGQVKRFPSHTQRNDLLRVPHIGWSSITRSDDPRAPRWEESVLRDSKDGDNMYFVHSYYVVPSDAGIVLSNTDYEGVRFCSSIHRRNIQAMQFHPEKSAQQGIQLYRAWKDIITTFKENAT